MTLLNTSSSKVEAALAADDKENFIDDPVAEEAPAEVAGIEGKLLTLEELRALNAGDGPKYVGIITRWYDECRNAMSERRRQWRLHEQFERGRQHIFYDEKAEEIKELPRKKGVPRTTVNKCRGVMRTEIAKFTAQKPTATALPASNDEEDRAAARAAEQLWASLYDRLKVHRKQRSVARWQSVTGLGYMKPYWDDSRYDHISGVFGDIAIDVVPPYNVFIPDVYIEDIAEQPYVIHAYLLPQDQVKMRFGDILGDGVANHDGGEEATEFGRIFEKGANSNIKHSLVKEVWVNPGTHTDLPDGAMLVVINNTIVEASLTGFPPGYTRYPLVKFEHINTGIYWPACVFDDIIPLQREINRSNGQVIQLKNAMIANGFFYQEGSMDPEKITTAPGQAIPYLPGFEKPVPIPIPQLPPHLAEVLNRTEMQIEDITGQHASTQGRHVPGLEAASAIGQLIEQDEAYIAPAIASIEEGLSVVASMAVTLFSVYATTERTVKIIGEDQGLDVVLMKGADVMGGTDIRMESASALPQSKSARQALILDLAATGAIPPQDLLSLLEVPQISNYLDKQMVRADENAQRRENIVFRMLAKQGEQQAQAYIEKYYQDWEARQAQGDPETFTTQEPIGPDGLPIPGAPPTQIPLAAPGLVPVNEWDDHAVHIYVLDLLVKSQWWTTCPKPVRAEVQKHRAAHVAALQQQQAMQAMMGAPAEAAPADAAPAEDPNAPDYQGRNEDQIQKGV